MRSKTIKCLKLLTKNLRGFEARNLNLQPELHLDEGPYVGLGV